MTSPDRKKDELAMYRAPMRARTLESGVYEGARLGTERAIVGIGEPLKEVPATLDHAILSTAEEHGDKAARMLARFADLSDGSLVWTRTADDAYRLGRIAGPWWYDESEAADRSGIHQVRATDWIPRDFDVDATPDAVIDTFNRGGRNLQRIRSRQAEQLSERLWHRDRASA